MNALAAIAVLRYIIVCKPEYEYYLKLKCAKYVVLGIIWSHSVIVTSMPLFGWSTYKQEAFRTSCSIDWTAKTTSVVSYNIFLIISCYSGHLAIFVFCYTHIIKTFKVADLMQYGTGDDRTLKLEKVTWYHKITTSRNVTVTSLSMVTVFIIAWTPYTLASLYTMSNDATSVWVIVVPTMLAKSCTLLNPVVCALTSSKFRKAARKMLTKNNTVQPTVAGIELTDGGSSPHNF